MSAKSKEMSVILLCKINGRNSPVRGKKARAYRFSKVVKSCCEIKYNL